MPDRRSAKEMSKLIVVIELDPDNEVEPQTVLGPEDCPRRTVRCAKHKHWRTSTPQPNGAGKLTFI